MEIILNTNILGKASDKILGTIALIGYVFGAIFYSLIKDKFAGRLLTKHVYILGSVSRATHVISYMFLGYIFPERFIFIMLLGAIWELVESIMGAVMYDKYWGEGQDCLYDIVANAIGFFIGYGFYRCG